MFKSQLWNHRHPSLQSKPDSVLGTRGSGSLEKEATGAPYPLRVSIEKLELFPFALEKKNENWPIFQGTYPTSPPNGP